MLKCWNYLAHYQPQIFIKTFSLFSNLYWKVTTWYSVKSVFFTVEKQWLKEGIIFLRRWDTKFRLTGQESLFSFSNKSCIGEQGRDFRAIGILVKSQVEQVRAHRSIVFFVTSRRHWWVPNHGIRVEWFDYSCPVMSHSQTSRSRSISVAN